MRVVIVGGGIGGLTLAHGLRRRGVEVSVHERDSTPSARWEGYRIHIDRLGHRALRACLPDPQWQAFLETAGRDGGMTLLTEQLEELMAARFEPVDAGGAADEDHHSVDRRVLRRILLSGLGDSVHLGAEFVGYETEPDGRVAAVFADGSRATGDVLVGADGAGSRVRRQYLPDTGRHETGAVGIGHQVYLDDDTRAWLPEAMTRGMTLTSAPGAMLFTAVFEPREGTAGRLTDLGVTDVPELAPYVLAALVVDPHALPADPVELENGPDPEALPRAVDRIVAGWHPTVRRLLTEADPASRGVQVFRASTPTPSWSPSRVTVLGDAIHQMPPVGGMGGNTALRDASLLSRLLAEAGPDPVPAIAAYEAEMREYAYPVVAESVARQEDNLHAGRGRRIGTRTALRVARRFPALGRLVGSRRPWGPPPRPWELDEGELPILPATASAR
jgi:2-polyprenyl-6-methoxyphenol hydroxylase-like FAD-dependent oxidoreductase